MNRIILLIITVFIALMLSAALPLVLPRAVDWEQTYRPATVAFLHGQDPYDPAITPLAPFFATPWTLVILAPFAIFPLQVGRVLLLFVGLAAFSYTIIKLGGDKVTVLAFLFSPPTVLCLINSNIEWIPMLGFVLPAPIGLFFVTTKPQTGFVMIIFWLVEAWHKGGWREVGRVFAPIGLVTLLSFAIYGLWPLHTTHALEAGRRYNTSLWPYSIPVGLALIFMTIYYRKKEFALPASPCLSPYVIIHSWSGVLAALAPRRREMITVVVALWILTLIPISTIKYGILFVLICCGFVIEAYTLKNKREKDAQK